MAIATVPAVTVDPSDLVDTAEIAERLGIAHRETVHNWRRRYAEFPAPAVARGQTLLWRWEDVQAWARSTGRLPA